MSAQRTTRSSSWFRGRGGRRFALEFGLIIVLKLAVLMLLWVLVIRPLPRADTAPDAIRQHFSAPSTEEPGR